MAAYRRLLRNRPLTRLLIGESISATGDWLYMVALLVVVYQVTSDPVILGIVGAARLVPFVLLSVPAGIAADRFDRRKILLFTDIARGLLMLVLAVLASTGGSILAIVAVAIGAACFSSFFGPALGAYLPALVTDEQDLGPANSLWATLDNLAYFIGPAVAGLLISVGGLGFAFLLNAASFGVVALILVTLPSTRPTTESTQDHALAPRQAIGTGALVRRILGPLLVDASTSFGSMAMSILIVLVAIDQLGVGEQAVGYLQAATGLGGIVAGFIAGWFVARRLDLPLITGSIIGAVGVGVLGLTQNLAIALVVSAVGVGAMLIMDIIVTTVVQREVADEFRGRAMGILQLTGVMAALAGSLVAPVLIPVIGLTGVFVVIGVGLVVTSVAAVFLSRADGSLRVLADVDSQRIALLRHSILVGAPAARLETAARRMRELAVSAGQVVVQQGDEPDRFYLIAAGRFVVDVTDGPGRTHRVRELGEGDPFGEIGLLKSLPRTATVTATTPGRLFTLERDEFLELVGQGSDLRSGLLSLYQWRPTQA